jgi:hypothetical protein
MSSIASVAGVCERDIDLLVLEEAVSTPGFRALLVSAVSWNPDGLELIEARRSVTHSNGESDIELAFARHNQGVVKLLIENKVSAGFQPNQAKRYRQRGAIYVERGDCVQTATLLLAPAHYLEGTGGTKDFDAALTYEQLVAGFDRSDLGARASVKAVMLRSAIDRAVIGYQPLADQVVTEFWREYWAMSLAHAAELEMREPAGKPARSGFIVFGATDLPPRSKLVHKCNHGFVDLQLAGKSDELCPHGAFLVFGGANGRGTCGKIGFSEVICAASFHSFTL